MEERRQDSKRRCFGFAGKHAEEGALQAETSWEVLVTNLRKINESV